MLISGFYSMTTKEDRAESFLHNLGGGKTIVEIEQEEDDYEEICEDEE